MDQSYWEKIKTFYGRHKRMPTYTEIMILTGFKSKNAVYKLLDRLSRANLIEKDDRGRISFVNNFNEARLLGVVEAGLPSAAEQEILETINLGEYLVRNPEETYVLTVKGDSMIDAGIRDGDLVVVEKSNTANDGDIVIAQMDGGWTMKYFRQRKGSTYLEPANKTMKPMYPEEDLKVAAIVKSVIRKYRN